MKSKWFGCFTLLVILVYAWAGGGSNGTLATKQPQDFYGFLTDAFLAGQTSLKVAPDPALQDLPNPWAGAQGIPRLHDASYFHGRYYIYFGPAPVFLLLLPWRVATGTFLAQGLATVIFGAAGTLISGALLLWAWRRWFSDLRPMWLALGLLLMAVSSRVAVLAEDSSVYQVPITCAFFCLMTAIGAATWAMTRPGGRAAVPLGLASLAWGLTVASRPDYAFSVAALAIPVAYLGVRDRPGLLPLFRLMLWTFLPAALLGAGLALYNFVRFGDILQFGMKYQFTAGDQRFLKFFSPDSLGDNLRRYFFSRPFYSSYFPFLVSGENWGILFCTPFALLAAALPFTLGARRRPARPGWCAWGLTLAVALLPNILLLCVLAIANERYFIDFLPLAILLSVVSAWALLRSFDSGLRLRDRLIQAAVCGLALWTIGQGALMLFHNYGDASVLRPLAQAADRVVAVVEAHRGIRHGPLRLRVRFPNRPPGSREPLLVSGHGNDILYVDYPVPGQIRIGFFHTGSGGPISDPIPIVTGRSYELRIDEGALYPPKDHPLLASWPGPLADVLLHRLDIALDGKTVLQGAEAFYPTYPGDLHVGRNPGEIYAPGKFSGELAVIAREGVPSPAMLRGPPGDGPVRLVVRFPAFQNFLREPLVSTGHSGKGDLLYVSYVAPGVIRLGHDSWGSGSLETAPLAYDPKEPQVIEADMASLRPMTGTRKIGTFALRFNGRLVMFARRRFNASPPAEVVFGFNGCNSSTAAATFSGAIVHSDRIGPIDPPRALEAAAGPVQLVLQFPADHAGFSQPLLAVGRRTESDLVYVHYLDNHRISIGYAHGDAAGLVTHPIAVDYGATHALAISLGSLYPAPGNDAWGTVPAQRQLQAAATTYVTLDGQPALLADTSRDPEDHRETATGLPPLPQRLAAGAFLPPDIQDGIGPVKLTLRFATGQPGRSEPLLATGSPGAGDVVYVHYIDEHHLSLGYDHWNSGGPLSAPLTVDYAADHVIEISLGSLYPAPGNPAWNGIAEARQHRLLSAIAVKLDGKAVLETSQVAYPSTAHEIMAGINKIGASTCGPVFTGTLVREQRHAPDSVGDAGVEAVSCEPTFTGTLFFQQRLPVGAVLPPDIQDGAGPVQLSLRFPASRPGRSEPLLVTGRTGAGDVVYVRYIDAHHLSLGYDHWNAGGPLSAPLAVDYTATHVIDVSLGSLYPARGDSTWGGVPAGRRRELLGTVSVMLDGKTVIHLAQTAYPAMPPEINAGANRIGASTCDPAFTGEIVEERRVAPDALGR